MKICSHTLVKNGMPFIGLVLRQAIPFVARCLITVSEKSDDGTLGILKELQLEYPHKIFIDFEAVNSPRELTKERQKQVDKTTEDWIWFLDDDDYWPIGYITNIVEFLDNCDNEFDALAVNPYQVLTELQHDWDWRHRWFTKFFRNDARINYRNPWPRDLIYLGDEVLYWKKNPRVKRIGTRFFHLSYIKQHSFRDEVWAAEFAHKVGNPASLSQNEKIHIERMYEQLRNNK